jgi:hypothetical protein
VAAPAARLEALGREAVAARVRAAAARVADRMQGRAA